MADFFAELKRRHIYRVGAAYVVVAWALTQGVATLTQVFMLPPWIAQTVIVLLAIGFPVTLIATWAMEGRRFEAVVSAVHSKSTVVDWTLCGALAVVVLLIGYQQLASPSIATVQQSGLDAARSAASSPASTISIAVLPFTNLSDDTQQQFFSDGITEEITSALARVPDLRVVARTSAYQFRDQNRDIQSIGQQLRATHFIEGSVRKAGERVRITAQLIKSDDGTHLWAENYDRELTDVFAIQEEIARAIATSLHMPLGIRPGENLVNNRNIDPESYDDFLRAKGIFIQRQAAGGGGGALAATLRAIPILERVVARNPTYAPGWGWLSACYSLVAQVHAQNPTEAFDVSRAAISELSAKGEAAARKAAELDPNETSAHTMLAIFAWSHGKMVEAEASYKKVLSLHPDSQQLTSYADRLADAGLLKQALEIIESAHAQDPLDPGAAGATIIYRWLNGDDVGAIALARTSPAQVRAPLLAAIYASEGRSQQAGDALSEIAGSTSPVVMLLQKGASASAAENVPSGPAYMRFLYPALGVSDRLIASYERQLDAGYLGGRQLGALWHPAYAAARKTEPFKALMRKVGLVDYWRAKGWPAVCRPLGSEDFVCD